MEPGTYTLQCILNEWMERVLSLESNRSRL